MYNPYSLFYARKEINMGDEELDIEMMDTSGEWWDNEEEEG
jgi:hypothetical protein